MISELHYLFCPPTVCEKTFTINRPSSLPIRFRTQSLRISTLTARGKAAVVDSNTSQVSVSRKKFTSDVMAAAQNDLFDYLHETRGLSSTDAEHISKNCPEFLKDLLSKLDKGHGISRALSKYFMYNPINEFEPFFESLGLNRSELPSLLPRSLMFLADDDLMFENFHVLCYYGIPRIKIGGMYKEAKEIFSYEHGVLSMKLRAYEELGLSKSTIIKLVTCCPLMLIGGVDNKLLVVLEKLQNFGFGSEWIDNFICDKTSINWNRMLDMMVFLMQVGYSEKQMELLLKKNPALSIQGSGKQIFILVERLLKVGLKMEHIYDLFLQNPQILSSKFAENLCFAVSFLLEIGMDKEAIGGMVSSYLQVLGLHSLKRPITVMKSLKIQKDDLCNIIKKDPLELVHLGSKPNNKGTLEKSKALMEKKNFLLRLGYVENSEELAKAMKEFKGRGDQLQERFDCLVQAGLDYHVVASMIKRAPYMLCVTKDMLEKKIDLLRNRLGYPLDSVLAFPDYFSINMQRIDLRFSMYLWLRERGKVAPVLSLSYLLACSDDNFVRLFVKSDPESEAMWEYLKT